MSCLYLSVSHRFLCSILAPTRDRQTLGRPGDDQQARGESQHCVAGVIEKRFQVFVLEKGHLR